MEEEQQSNIDVKYRLGLISGTILIIVACLADLAELIVDLATGGVGGWIVDVLELLIIFPILWLNKVNPVGTRQIGRWLLVIIVSFIPWVSTIAPEMIIGVVLTIIATRTEDRTGKQFLDKIKVKPGVVRAKRVRPLKGPPRRSDAVYNNWVTRQKRSTPGRNIPTPPPMPNRQPPPLPRKDDSYETFNSGFARNNKKPVALEDHLKERNYTNEERNRFMENEFRNESERRDRTKRNSSN